MIKIQDFNELIEITKLNTFKHILSKMVYNDFTSLPDNITKRPSEHEELDYNELLLLMGLWVQNVDITNNIAKENIDSYVNDVYTNLEELHRQVFIENKNPDDLSIRNNTSYEELFFYSPTNAYDIQYAYLVGLKYQLDRDFIFEKYGQRIELYNDYFFEIKKLILDRMNDSKFMKNIHKTKKYIRLFQIDDKDLKKMKTSGFKEFIDFYSIERNSIPSSTINRIADYNPLRERPIIKDNDKYLIFSTFHLAEAMWERFYYLMNTSEYKDEALANRGEFTEELVYIYLKNTFRDVYKNVVFNKSRKEQLTDVDVMAVYEETAFLFMIKSKKLTLLSRKGNSDKVFDDYKKAIKDSFKQGLLAEEMILNNQIKINKNEDLKEKLNTVNEVYIITITIDDYPYQNILNHIFLEQHDKMPISMSIFDLEVLLNYLEDPKIFLEYTRLRYKYMKKFRITSEMGFLEFFLENKDTDFKDYDLVYLDKSWADALDKKYYYKLLRGETKYLFKSV